MKLFTRTSPKERERKKQERKAERQREVDQAGMCITYAFRPNTPFPITPRKPEYKGDWTLEHASMAVKRDATTGMGCVFMWTWRKQDANS